MRKMVSVCSCILSRNIFEEGKRYQMARESRSMQYFKFLEVLTKWDHSWLWFLQSSPRSTCRVEHSIGLTLTPQKSFHYLKRICSSTKPTAGISSKDLRTHHVLVSIHEPDKGSTSFRYQNRCFTGNWCKIHNERRYPQISGQVNIEELWTSHGALSHVKHYAVVICMVLYGAACRHRSRQVWAAVFTGKHG